MGPLSANNPVREGRPRRTAEASGQGGSGYRTEDERPATRWAEGRPGIGRRSHRALSYGSETPAHKRMPGVAKNQAETSLQSHGCGLNL